VEEQVNLWIMEGIDVETIVTSYQDAVKMGAIALFDEKYGAEVRVIKIDDVSMELCGGTHIDNTAKIGSFYIVSETSIAAGVRRIEGVTGIGAVEYARGVMDREAELADLLNGPAVELVRRVQGIISENEELRKKLKRALSQDNVGLLDKIISSAKVIDGVTIATGRLQMDDISMLRNQADVFRNRVKSGVAALSSEVKGKLQVVITVTDDLVNRGITADGIVSELSKIVVGGGGGKKHLAQFGTKDFNSEEKVFKGVLDIVKKSL